MALKQGPIVQLQGEVPGTIGEKGIVLRRDQFKDRLPLRQGLGQLLGSAGGRDLLKGCRGGLDGGSAKAEQPDPKCQRQRQN
jgi:hypothetical protein